MAEPLLKFGDHWNFKNNDRVVIYNLDQTGREWKGTIRGKVSDNVIDTYIVEPDEKLSPDYEFDCIAMTEACLKPLGGQKKVAHMQSAGPLTNVKEG